MVYKKMSKPKRQYRSYDDDFKLKVLKDMYENCLSAYSVCQKYGILSHQTIKLWEKAFPLDSNSLSLSSETIERVNAMRTKKEKDVQSKILTREQELEAQVAMLRKALQYSELRNEALNEVIKVYNESEGVDILKKVGSKQR